LPFGDLFEHSPLATCVTRRSDGCFVAVNAAWEALTATPRSRVLGRTTVDIGHWADAAERQTFLDGLSALGDHRCIQRHNGEQVHVRVHAALLPVDPEPLLMIHLIDISHEVEAEQARDRSRVELQDANRELQQQIELHGAVEKLARVGHWTNARNDQEVIWSPGLYEIAGLPPQRTLQRSEGRSGIHPDDMPAWLAAREACDSRVVEFRWQRPDGPLRWFRTRIGRTAVAGNPQTDFGVVHDITAEREATQAQATQLAFFQNITSRAPGILYQSRLQRDGSGTFPYLSDGAADMLEMDPGVLQADGQQVLTRIHPDDRKPLVSAIVQSARLLTLARHVVRVVLPRKGLRWYSVEAMPQREASGATVWHGVVSDVTDSHLATRAIERQNRMLDAVRQAQASYIEAEDDKRQCFENLLDAFLSVTGSTYGFVGEVLYDPQDQPYFQTHAITNIAWDDASRRMFNEQIDAGMEFRNLKTLFGHAMSSGETVISNRPDADERRGGMPSGHPSMTAFLGVPIALGDRLVAMVGLANQPGGYSTEDVEFLQPLLGTVRQLVLALRGHAERRRARLQLQAAGTLLAEKTAALQVTLDSMSQGLSKVDEQGRVTIYNRRLLELLDLPNELLASQPRHEMIVRYQTERGDFGPDMELVDPRARDYVALKPVNIPEKYWRKTRDGRTLEIRSRSLPEGGMVRTYSDVTPYIEAEEALRAERQRLAWVLEATAPGIWEMNIATGETTYSERWAELLGYTLDELKPTTTATWRQLVHPRDLARAMRLLIAHWAGEIPYYECDVRMRHKRGHWVWLNDRGRVHRRDAQGKALYMSGTLLDIHERVTAQEEVRALNASLERRVAERTAELERSMKDMEAISYSIAHDLRAPLRSVNGFAALIAESDEDRLSPEGREMFGRIARSSRNMGQMISDMLELLRVVRVEIAAVPVDMNALARTVTEALAPAVPHARIEIDQLPAVQGDAKLLQQVLANLIDNALKYSRHREDPLVTLGFDVHAGAFFLRDNGMGFDMAHASKLFGLFQRLHAGADVPGGTGVGLAIVSRTLERHGGRIWAESAPGAGATFWWTLPLS
jgi:PAS domain S-box-containing protein